MYRFDWTLPGHPTFGQAVHGAEIAFVFDNLELLDKLGLEIQPSMQKLAQDMQQAWVAFARDGKPVLSEGLGRCTTEKSGLQLFSIRILRWSTTLKEIDAVI